MARARCARGRSRSCGRHSAFAKGHRWPLRNNKQEMAAADVRFDRLALTQGPALALKLSPAASPCTRPPMASALKKSKVGQGRWRYTEDVTPSPQPGDQSPCLHCLSMQTTVVCVRACVPAFVFRFVQSGCGGGCMGASVCVRTCMLGHIAATAPELACSHDKRCTPNLSGCARRSGSRLRPNVCLFHVTVVWMGSLLRIVLCMPSGVRSSA